MKKTLSMLCLVLVLSLLLAPPACAAGGNYDTLTDWDIRIAVPDEATAAVLKGSEYYIYAQHEGSIPYVMLKTYNYDSEELFLEEFTTYMQKQYADLKVVKEAAEKTVGDRNCLETDYTYTVQGYDVLDRRIVFVAGGRLYMFASKEIASLGMTVGGMLEEVVANAEILSENIPEPDEDGSPVAAYLYCRENGMPKYWLDCSAILSDNPVLHCYFRSGDPTFYESTFVLDWDTAEMKDGVIYIHDIYDRFEMNRSDWFKELSFAPDGNGIVMNVVRDERTLAGGSEDNILTGEYPMLPIGVGVDVKVSEDDDLSLLTYPAAAEKGPFTPEELAAWAQISYFRNTGFFPPEKEAAENDDGTVTIHLFEIVDLDGITHTATSAWYTVDRFGLGSNDITGEEVDLCH